MTNVLPRSDCRWIPECSYTRSCRGCSRTSRRWDSQSSLMLMHTRRCLNTHHIKGYYKRNKTEQFYYMTASVYRNPANMFRNMMRNFFHRWNPRNRDSEDAKEEYMWCNDSDENCVTRLICSYFCNTAIRIKCKLVDSHIKCICLAFMHMHLKVIISLIRIISSNFSNHLDYHTTVNFAFED